MIRESGSITQTHGFTPETVLKRDIFSETVSGRLTERPDTKVALRDLTGVPWYARPLSQILARRESRALRAVQGIEGVPVLLSADRTGILREWIDGTPLQFAKPIDPAFYRDARRLLRDMRRRGVTHNDLAKPQNWLTTPDGRAAVIDFQLASVHRHSGRMFRVKGYEDLRHLLKLKRAYAPHLLTTTEAQVAATRSVPSLVWHVTGKRLYNFVTRRLMNWSDSEGAGQRFEETRDAIAAAISDDRDIRGHALFAYPLTGKGIGLYLFVETDLPVETVTARLPEPRPDLVHPVDVLPRHADGTLREDFLALIAANRTDEIETMLATEPESQTVLGPIIAKRLNLTDRLL